MCHDGITKAMVVFVAKLGDVDDASNFCKLDPNTD